MDVNGLDKANNLISSLYNDITNQTNTSQINDDRLNIFQEIFIQLSEYNRSNAIPNLTFERLKGLMKQMSTSAWADRARCITLGWIMLRNFSSVTADLMIELYKTVMKEPSHTFANHLNKSGGFHLSDVSVLCRLKKRSQPVRTFLPIKAVYITEIEQFLKNLRFYSDVKMMVIMNTTMLMHTTAVYIQKDNNDFRFIILDGIGIRDEKGKQILPHIIGLIKTIKFYMPECKILLPNFARQWDERACFLFSINDSLKFSSTMADKIFSQSLIPVDTLPEVEWSQLQDDQKKEVFTFQYIPPQLMNLTQSSKVLASYGKEHLQECVTPMVTRTTDKRMETLFDNIKRFTFVVCKDEKTKSRNFHAEYKYCKHLVRVLHFQLYENGSHASPAQTLPPYYRILELDDHKFRDRFEEFSTMTGDVFKNKKPIFEHLNTSIPGLEEEQQKVISRILRLIILFTGVEKQVIQNTFPAGLTCFGLMQRECDIIDRILEIRSLNFCIMTFSNSNLLDESEIRQFKNKLVSSDATLEVEFSYLKLEIPFPLFRHMIDSLPMPRASE